MTRILLSILLLAAGLHAEFQVDLIKSQIPSSVTLSGGAIVAVSNGAMFLEETGIGGQNNANDPYLHLYFAHDDLLANGSEIQAVFAYFNCNGSTIQRNYEGTQIYLWGTPIPFVLQLSGLEDECSGGEPVPFALHPVSPNPLSAAITIGYGLPAGRTTSLRLNTLDGVALRYLTNGTQAAGEHTVAMSLTGVPMGLYHLSLVAGSDSTGQLICLQGNPLIWPGAAQATTDAEGTCFLPAYLFPNGLNLSARDAQGNSLGSQPTSMNIVLVKNGQRLSGCTLTRGASGAADYLIQLP
ncbi:MAG: hypothetical protein H6678_08200 [Candidatus Delongbacteria bacterium]|nr:hypothetical protein [Candidatus Delongbacteria bacterium]